MVPTFGLLFVSLLLIGALWWIKEMFGRWRSDLEELRDPQTEWIPHWWVICRETPLKFMATPSPRYLTRPVLARYITLPASACGWAKAAPIT